MVGMDASILMHPRVWVASGHVDTFADPMVDCRSCQGRFRADDLDGDTCPTCSATGQFTEARMFNLLFKTFAGPVEDEASIVYLRPETAQGMFVNFANVLGSTRKKLPFGMAQIGKSFRNEVTPRHFIFRTREFEQMEIEFFVRPQEAERWHQYWMEERLSWYVKLGIRRENLRLHAHAKEDLAHYAAACSDVEYEFPMGWLELEGVANRTDFDLRQHSEASGVNLTYFDEETGEHITPYIIEPSAGVDRPLLAFIVDAYREEEVRGEKRVVLRLHPALAPVKATVLPLSRNEKLVPKAREVWAMLRPHFMTLYDDAQSIGRRYRRQDEIGTPYCVTVDFDTLEDEAVTIRERDSMEQARVPVSGLVEALRERLPPS
jgi:glycyl-tRNA synthetase